MIIKTKVETKRGAMRIAYYKHMGANGKPVLGGKGDAATFDDVTAKKVLSHLAVIDARFIEAELSE